MKYLYLGGNSLESLPEEIGNLVNLEYLDLGCAIPESRKESRVYNQYFGRLEDEDLPSCNTINSLPKTIGQLESLKVLYLDGNPLKELPDEVGNLSSLEELYLGFSYEYRTWSAGRTFTNAGNKEAGVELRTLPNSIGNLTSLVFFSVSYGELRRLPESIGNLANLEELYLHNNKLTGLPESMANLSSLENFSLDGGDNITVSDLSGSLQLFLNFCCLS